jgi:hypothetical protein
MFCFLFLCVYIPVFFLSVVSHHDIVIQSILAGWWSGSSGRAPASKHEALSSNPIAKTKIIFASKNKHIFIPSHKRIATFKALETKFSNIPSVPKFLQLPKNVL